MPLSDSQGKIGAPRFELGHLAADATPSDPVTPCTSQVSDTSGGVAWTDLNQATGSDDGRAVDARPCSAVRKDGSPCPHKASPFGDFLWLCWRHHRRLANQMFEDMLGELRADSGWVYFAVRTDKPGLVKIGYTTDVRRRMVDLQAHPLVVMPYACRQTEAEFHAEFADLRVEGEWFRLEGDLLALVNASLKTQKGWTL